MIERGYENNQAAVSAVAARLNLQAICAGSLRKWIIFFACSESLEHKHAQVSHKATR